MTVFKLRGLAEGLVGKSEVSALNKKDLFKRFPVFKSVREKIFLKKGYVAGFSACDG